MTGDKNSKTTKTDKPDKQNRVREALGRLYEEYPPYFREYLRRYEEDPTSRVFAPLAEAYRKLGRLDDAIQICREGLSHHPEFHGGRVALAKCLMEKGDMGGARVELERVIRVAPENLLAQRLMGDVAHALGDSVTALHAYKMALLLAPNDVTLAEKVHELEHLAAVFLHSGGISPDGNLPIVAAPKEARVSEDIDEPTPLWASQSGTSSEPIFAYEADLKQTSESEVAMDPLEIEASDGISSLPIDQLIGDDADSIDDEGFKIEHISSIFDEDAQRKKGITTETLGDLYFSQGQYERALKIFDKLPRTPELSRKIRDCKSRLGVDDQQLNRSRQIAVLKGIVERARQSGGKN